MAHHSFDADEDSPTLDKLGNELDASYVRKFGKRYSAGLKYADYNAKDFAVDTKKLWFWLGFSF